MKIKLLLLLPLAMTLTACSSSPDEQSRIMTYITTDSAPTTVTDANTQNQLAQAANSVSQSLQQLSAVQQAVHPNAKIAPPVNPKRIGMAQVASLQWTGPIEPLLRKIAGATNYKLQVIGNTPSTPIIVSISKKNQPLATILRDAIFQAQGQASISVYPANKMIELRYNN